MPKNSALLNEIESVLKIYYEAGDWLPNDVYKAKLKQMIGDDQYSSSYTKKAQITSYFGFTVWENITNPQSRRRITPSGKRMYEAILKQDTSSIQEVLMDSLGKVKFGRDNFGCPDSDSDVEPPSLFIRAILDLGYLTYKEFAYLLWKLEDVGANYSDSLLDIKRFRTSNGVELGEQAIKYTDCKPIMILVRWGFLVEDENETSGGKHIRIHPEVLTKYSNRLKNLKIYNIDMNVSSLTEDNNTSALLFTPEWFKNKENEFVSDNQKANELYDVFQAKFSIQRLSSLNGEDLVKYLFLGGRNDNLCHELEYVSENNRLFASCKGGNAFKYPLHLDKDTLSWVTGTQKNPVDLTLNDAIDLAAKIRDSLVSCLQKIDEVKDNLSTMDDYLALYQDLHVIAPNIVDSLWVMKYFHMMFPALFPVFYNYEWQAKVLNIIDKEPNATPYGRWGQIKAFVDLCDISNVVFAQIIHKYGHLKDVSDDFKEEDKPSIEEPTRLKGGQNIILYGVPGAGKSFTLENDYKDSNTEMKRVVFHPDYTYSDFVGQILPLSKDGDVRYDFIPGPFASIVKKAYENPTQKFILAIEEINRGNAPAIFGDIFQLLDRDQDGKSKYTIANKDVAKIVFNNENKEIYIPSNLYLICTMNTSDQNVFTLDTAFQRRWHMRLIENEFKEDTDEEKRFANHPILDTDVSWKKFCKTINDQILDKNQNMTSSEDKRLGTHFVLEDDLTFDENEKSESATHDEKKAATLKNRRFPEKVIKYLWDDAFKFYRDEIFNPNHNSLEKIIAAFTGSTGNDRFNIFKETIKAAIVDKQN